MIFVDTNVFMYAVGRSHPLRNDARTFFEASKRQDDQLVTSAEVFQELLHAYLPVDRIDTLDAALILLDSMVTTIWSIEEADVRLARRLVDQHASLSARDLLHLASCRRRNVAMIKTFDRGLTAAMKG